MENDLLGGVDVGHQLTRLRSGKRMSSGEAELIMKTLVEIASRGDEAIIAVRCLSFFYAIGSWKKLTLYDG